jgi:hypothetical protein
VFLALEYRSSLVAGTTILGLLVSLLWLLARGGERRGQPPRALLAVGGGAAATRWTSGKFRDVTGAPIVEKMA